ncbi:MAG: hypothetical protein EOO53_22365, partial [Gammaproteobacteria bacterium]
MIQVFSGTCGSLTPVGCGQDAVNLTGLSIGSSYFVRVYSAGANGSDAIAGPANPTATAFNIAVTPAGSTVVSSSRMNEVYLQTNLASENMTSDPWEITYGPDNFLWVTEAKGYRVFRMNPNTGARTTVLDISSSSTFLSPADTSFNMRYEIGINNPQGGLAGLAIHPKFMDATAPQNYVYVAYVYQYNYALAGNNGTFYTNRIVRFTYNTVSGKLESPVSLCDTLPGSNDHNSQRMIIAPVAGTNYLFYAQGDMGAGQFSNQYRSQKAQDSASYEGKILRFNLLPDGDAGSLDRWIPNDNPYNASLGKQSAVWAIGIRNNQTINASGFAPYKDPLFSAYAQSQATVNYIWKNNPGNGSWPSEGWSGLDLYTHPLIPGWKNSLIACSLKWGRLVKMKLNNAGTSVVRTYGYDTVSYFGGQNRFRDLAISPDGKDLFVVMDRSTTSSGPSNANPVVPACPGCVQKYTFLGYADAAGKSSIR